VTTYDGFGNVAETYQADSIGWWHDCCELDNEIYLNMPAMIIEDNKLEPDWLQIANADSQHPHEITLLSFDNKIIKKWASNYPPAKRGNWAQFTSDRRSTQIAGCMIIKRIKK
jgi:hypothetical protein